MYTKVVEAPSSAALDIALPPSRQMKAIVRSFSVLLDLVFLTIEAAKTLVEAEQVEVDWPGRGGPQKGNAQKWPTSGGTTCLTLFVYTTCCLQN